MSRFSNALISIVHDSVLNCSIPTGELAQKIGKKYPTLMRELNPYDPGAKLGVDTVVDIMKATGDVKPLEYIAGELGYRVVPE